MSFIYTAVAFDPTCVERRIEVCTACTALHAVCNALDHLVLNWGVELPDAKHEILDKVLEDGSYANTSSDRHNATALCVRLHKFQVETKITELVYAN